MSLVSSLSSSAFAVLTNGSDVLYGLTGINDLVVVPSLRRSTAANLSFASATERINGAAQLINNAAWHARYLSLLVFVDTTLHFALIDLGHPMRIVRWPLGVAFAIAAADAAWSQSLVPTHFVRGVVARFVVSPPFELGHADAERLVQTLPTRARMGIKHRVIIARGGGRAVVVSNIETERHSSVTTVGFDAVISEPFVPVTALQSPALLHTLHIHWPHDTECTGQCRAATQFVGVVIVLSIEV